MTDSLLWVSVIAGGGLFAVYRFVRREVSKSTVRLDALESRLTEIEVTAKHITAIETKFDAFMVAMEMRARASEMRARAAEVVLGLRSSSSAQRSSAHKAPTTPQKPDARE
jgi:hypothetical protein